MKPRRHDRHHSQGLTFAVSALSVVAVVMVLVTPRVAFGLQLWYLGLVAIPALYLLVDRVLAWRRNRRRHSRHGVRHIS